MMKINTYICKRELERETERKISTEQTRRFIGVVDI
jgi:hypothetical protein